MSKAKSGQSDNRNSSTAKSGKRASSPVYPLPLSPARQAAKEAGEQQFVAKEQLTQEIKGTVIVFDQKTKQFVYKTKKITVPADYVFDKTRGRVVWGPYYGSSDKL